MQQFKHSRVIQNENANEILKKLKELIHRNKFSVLHVHDVKTTLQEKGFDIESYYIVEFCRAPAAYKVLSEDPDIGLFMPCKFLLIQQESSVRITTFLPTSIGSFFPELDLSEVAQKIEQDILAVMAEI